MYVLAPYGSDCDEDWKPLVAAFRYVACFARLVQCVADVNVYRNCFKGAFPWENMRLLRLSRVTLPGDEELLAMWCFLQLSRTGTVNPLGPLAPITKVNKNALLYNKLFVVALQLCSLCFVAQDFNARGLRRALALSLILREPLPDLPAACVDPSCIASFKM